MRSRRVLELALGITVALLLSGGAVYATTPRQPHTQPTVTTDTSTSAGPCTEGAQR